MEEDGYQMSGHAPYLKLKTTANLILPMWSTTSIYGLTAAMLAAITAAVVYECLHEYLRFLRNTAMENDNSPTCFGTARMTCGEKLGQSVIQMIRVLTGYFMMLCVMTMNIWLLVSVVVGAAVGYGAFKPLIANSISDTVTSHEYNITQVTYTKRGRNRSQRSTSWRYRTIDCSPVDGNMFENESVFDDNLLISKDVRYPEGQTIDQSENETEVVWVRRSDLDPSDRFTENCVHDYTEDQLLNPGDKSLTDSLLTPDTSSLSRTFSRFRSTSKVINDSILTDLSGSLRSNKSKTSSSSMLGTVELRSATDQNRTGKRTSSKVSRAESTLSSRFKPISREIMRHQSFRDEFE